MSETKQDLISYAMYKHKVTKRQLALELNVSYPTMLHKINNPDVFRVHEVNKLCKVLDITKTEFINLK